MIQKLTIHTFEDFRSTYNREELSGYILQHSKTYINSPVTENFIPCKIKVDSRLVYVDTNNGVYAWPISVFNEIGLYYNDNVYGENTCWK